MIVVACGYSAARLEEVSKIVEQSCKAEESCKAVLQDVRTDHSIFATRLQACQTLQRNLLPLKDLQRKTSGIEPYAFPLPCASEPRSSPNARQAPCGMQPHSSAR